MTGRNTIAALLILAAGPAMVLAQAPKPAEPPPAAGRRQALDAEFIGVMPASPVFDYLGTTVNGPRAENAKIVLNWRFTDSGETIVSTLDHAALTYVSGKRVESADASATTTRAVFNAIVLRQRTFDDARTKAAS